MPTVEEEIIARLDGVVDALVQPKTSYEILRVVGAFPPRHVSAVALRRVCDLETYEGEGGGGGPPGPQGIQGDPGATGPQGIEGPQGPPGAQGPAGAEGAQGVAGPDGATGAQGPQGPQGETGEGIKILGEVATPNDLPAAGRNAGDAYIVTSDGDLHVWSTDLTPAAWVDAGQIVGPQGPIGPQGVQGPPGSQGLQGAQGPQGEQGIQGSVGQPGQQGTQGSQGIQGIQGAQGNTGAQGATGPSGATVLDLLPPYASASAAATNLAAATFNAVGDMNYRRMIDLRGKTKLKVMGRIGGALVAATKLRIQYHTAGNVAVATGDAGWQTLATTAGSHTLNTLFYSAELAVPAGAQINDCLVRVGLFDGDGAADPTITTCCLNFYP